MSDAQPDLHGIAVYNPDLLSKAELIGCFVARHALLDRLVDAVRRAGRAEAPSHHLLIGPRGMGKTTLLRRLRYAVDDDPELCAAWLPLTFPEEQYNVARLSDFYVNCLDAQGDALEARGRGDASEELDRAIAALPDRDEKARTAAAAELHEAVLCAEVAMESWDAEAFADLLGGSSSLSPEQRLAIATALPTLATSQVSELFRHLREEQSKWRALWGSDRTRALAEAFRQGWMQSLDDVEGAAAADIAMAGSGLEAIAWSTLGDESAKDSGRAAEAEAAYRKAIELDPKKAWPWNSLAWHLYTRGKALGEAEAAARAAVDRSPNDPYFLHTLAIILAAQGKWDEAREPARRFLVDGPQQFHDASWDDIVAFFREAVRTGHAADARDLLDAVGLGERWRPLREALDVLASGNPDRLLRIAAEVRGPAEQILASLSAGR